MAKIKDEKQYQIILKRVEALMDIVTEDTPPSDPDFVELDLLADLAEEYEIARKMHLNLNIDANLILA